MSAPPSREGLIERWLSINHAHARASLEGTASRRGPRVDLNALARHEFAIPGRYRIGQPTGKAHELWWLPIWNWLADRWYQLWQVLFGRVHVRGAGPAIGDVLIALVAAVLLFAAWRLLVHLHVVRSRRAGAHAPAAAPGAQTLYRQACAQAREGRYGAASRLLFAAMVAALDLQGLTTGDRSATVGDLRRELRAREAALLDPFDAIARTFVMSAYAERDVDAAAWEGARAAFSSIARKVPQT